LLNFVWLFELLSDLLLIGLKTLKQELRTKVEAVCQIIAGAAVVIYMTSGDYNATVRLLQIVIFIRTLKLLALISEIKTLRLIGETLGNMIGPIARTLAVLLLVMYFYAFAGMRMFGGLVTEGHEGVPGSYHLMNFNDILSSFVTLYALIIVNNWWVISGMYVDIMGGSYVWQFFFISFYYFSIIIGVNLFVAQVLNMYAAVEKLDNEKTEQIKIIDQ
jgi:hypothetical protein